MLPRRFKEDTHKGVFDGVVDLPKEAALLPGTKLAWEKWLNDVDGNSRSGFRALG